MNEVPRTWATRPFGELNGFYGANIDPASYPAERFELYSIPVFPTGKPEQPLGSEVGSTKQVVAHNDVLISKINPRINRVWQVGLPTGLRQIASSEWIGFRCTQMDARYFRYYFTSPTFRDLLCSDVTGVGGSLTRAQPKRVASFPVPVAPVNEQKRIADKLDTVLTRVDAVNTRLARVAPLLKRFRQSVLATATSGRLTEDWRTGKAESDFSGAIDELMQVLGVKKTQGTLKPTAIRTAPYLYETRSLSNLGQVSGGLTKNGTRNAMPLSRPYLRVANVYANELRLSDVSEIGLTAAELQKTRLLLGDLLLVEGNGSLDQIGRVAMWDGSIEDCCHQNHLIRWRAGDQVISKFVLYYLLSPLGRAQIEEVAKSTSGLHTLSVSKVAALSLKVPDLQEQTEIVRRIETLFAFADRLEARLQTAQTATERLTPSLLAKAFCGELVPQDPNDEPASELLKRLAEQGPTSKTTRQVRKVKSK